MGLTRLAVDRPLTVLMGILGLVLMGAVAYTKLNVDRLPRISIPVVTVTVTYPQASPQDVERLVTQPIENALAGVAGADVVTSTSTDGRSQVRITFVEGTDPDLAVLDVERRLARIRNRLPADIVEPSVAKADPNEFPIMNIALTGAPLDQLYDVAVDQLQPRLQSVPGAGSVNITGGLRREVQVRVSYERLAAYNLSVQQISTALIAANVTTTAGLSQQGSRLLSIRGISAFETAADLGNVVVAQTSGGTPILLRDVALVSEGFKDRTSLQRFNGKDAVGLSVVKASTANALEVTDQVRAELEEMKPLLPAGTSLHVTNDASIATRRALNAVQKDIVIAVLVVGLVIFLFLHDWRNLVIVTLSIPTVLISTFLFMYLLGFTLNLMTLMALALLVGILVDASIVVNENIYRHIRAGVAPRDAALTGRQEIATATLAIAAADLVVYLPIAFMSGLVGQLFREYGLTVAVATALSVVESFTLTPMLASRWLGRSSDSSPMARLGKHWEAGFDRIAGLAERLVPVAVRARWAVVLGSLLLVAGSIALVQARVVGTEYVPQEDRDTFQATLTMPTGTSLDATDRAARQLEEGLRRIPEIEDIYTSVSIAGGGLSTGSRAVMTVQLSPKEERSRSVGEIIRDVRSLGRQIPGGQVVPFVPSSLPGGGGSGRLDIDVIGPDFETITFIIAQIKASAAGIEGLADLQDNSLVGNPELRVVVDSARMAQLNVTAQQVMNALRTTIGGQVVTEFRPSGGGLQRDITLIASDADRHDLTKLAGIPVRGGASLNPGQSALNSQVVTLGQVATFKYGDGPAQIQRVNRNRSLTITGTAVGRPMGDVAQDLKEAALSVELPPGYILKPGRQVNQFNNTLTALAQAMALALVLEYMLLVALYHSWFHPLALMFSVPLGLVGSIAALYVTGNTINVFSLIGLIMAFGLVAKNGILLVDLTNSLRADGMERTRALAQAVRLRLRPILMTSATMVGGMLPLALKLEAGGESRAPMAVVVIGGVVTSTLLATVVIPAVYTLVDDLQAILSWRRAPAPVAAAPVPQGVAGEPASAGVLFTSTQAAAGPQQFTAGSDERPPR